VRTSLNHHRFPAIQQTSLAEKFDGIPLRLSQTVAARAHLIEKWFCLIAAALRPDMN
jgi:hypothetical protein